MTILLSFKYIILYYKQINGFAIAGLVSLVSPTWGGGGHHPTPVFQSVVFDLFKFKPCKNLVKNLE